MAKFKLTLKIQGLELEVEGEREVIPQLTQAVQKQISGMLTAPAVLADGKSTVEVKTEPPPPAAKSKRRTPRPAAHPSSEANASVTAFLGLESAIGRKFTRAYAKASKIRLATSRASSWLRYRQWCESFAKLYSDGQVQFPFRARSGRRLKLTQPPVITVIGKAFFDIGHAPADHSNRRTNLQGYAAWEIHPVMKMEVIQ
jgi:hypothetical protein